MTLISAVDDPDIALYGIWISGLNPPVFNGKQVSKMTKMVDCTFSNFSISPHGCYFVVIPLSLSVLNSSLVAVQIRKL